jgi:SAM-dependent methyltransferase
MVTPVQTYSLGASEAELARLDAQAASIAMPTATFLRSAGVASGMRVLDLGTGLGHVAFELAELVGPAGAVVGIDQAPAMLAVAEQRRVASGIENVRFVDADVHAFRDGEAFDAIVGRLILFHLPDPVEVLRHHVGGLAEDGLMLMIDFDVGSVRSEPPVPLFDTARDWVIQAFRRAGANPMIGIQLGVVLHDAGLNDIQTFGIQSYLAPDDAAAPALLSGVVNSLAPVIVESGIATEEEMDLDSLQERLSHELQASRAVGLIPAVAGAWGRRRAWRVTGC